MIAALLITFTMIALACGLTIEIANYVNRKGN